MLACFYNEDALAIAALSGACAAAEEKVDLAAIYRIKNEAFQHSKVMDHAFYLTDVYGPRLTGSPGLKAAAEWAVKRFNEWGLVNAESGEVGALRTRLVAGEVQRASQGAAVRAADRLQPSVVAGHEWSCFRRSPCWR